MQPQRMYSSGNVVAPHTFSPEIATSAHETLSLEGTLGSPANSSNRYVGPTSEFEPLLFDSDSSSQGQGTAFGAAFLRKVGQNVHFMQSGEAGTDAYYREMSILDSIETIVRPHQDALVELYFQMAHPAFPILHRNSFMENYANRHRGFSPPLLAAVYALALNWWSHDSRVNQFQKPDASALENLAHRALLGAMQRPKLSTIQAGLLLLQRSDREPPSALSGQLVAIGQDLGLHLDCSAWDIPEWEKGLRKRVAWALFVQDVWSSSTIGRPRHISDSNWAVNPLADTDFPEPAQGREENNDDTNLETGQNIFVSMISLSKMLSEVLDSLYSQRADIQIRQSQDVSATQAILSLAKPIQLRLRSWYSNLTSGLPLDSITSGRVSPLGSLHLAYFATEITLHRRIIRSVSPSTDSHVVTIIRSAAKARLISSLDFFNRLRPEHLRGSWYFGSSVNFAVIGSFGCLLWKTSLTKDEANFYRQRLQEYRWTLGVSRQWTNAGVLDLACGNLDILLGHIGKGETEPQSQLDLDARSPEYSMQSPIHFPSVAAD